VVEQLLTLPVSIVTAQNEKTTLLGKTKEDYASILRWMSFANSEVLSPLGDWFRPLIGRGPYNKKNVDSAEAVARKSIGVVENHLTLNTFLVGERLSLADIFAASIFARGFEFVSCCFDMQSITGSNIQSGFRQGVPRSVP
jgi:elongation factor 1-gamma